MPTKNKQLTILTPDAYISIKWIEAS